ncbi:MAG: RNA polymerase subunit sigma-24, partial [Burkholderiales bacterium]|nr:RNA polymerase subunit sigma-24 [Opitutaceae bacterium]
MSNSFATTRWTLVLDAARHGNADTGDTAAGRALEELCVLYRTPLIAHARRRGLAPADAEDAIQGLFATLIDRDCLGSVRRERGRFRTWLLSVFEHHLADARARARCLKRGGDAPHATDPAPAL